MVRALLGKQAGEQTPSIAVPPTQQTQGASRTPTSPPSTQQPVAPVPVQPTPAQSVVTPAAPRSDVIRPLNQGPVSAPPTVTPDKPDRPNTVPPAPSARPRTPDMFDLPVSRPQTPRRPIIPPRPVTPAPPPAVTLPVVTPAEAQTPPASPAANVDSNLKPVAPAPPPPALPPRGPLPAAPIQKAPADPVAPVNAAPPIVKPAPKRATTPINDAASRAAKRFDKPTQLDMGFGRPGEGPDVPIIKRKRPEPSDLPKATAADKAPAQADKGDGKDIGKEIEQKADKDKAAKKRRLAIITRRFDRDR